MSIRTALHRFELVKLLRASIVRTLLFRAFTRTDGASVYIYPDVHVYTARDARVVGRGRLDLGSRWKHTRFYPSQMQLLRGSTIHVAGEFRLETGFSLKVGEGATLRLGSGFINNHGTIECDGEVRIGQGVFIGKHVFISDTDGHTVLGSSPRPSIIEIEDHVWVGEGVKILKSVRIGAGAVVAAGAVVTRDIPPKALAAGVPARVIRQDVEWR